MALVGEVALGNICISESLSPPAGGALPLAPTRCETLQEAHLFSLGVGKECKKKRAA